MSEKSYEHFNPIWLRHAAPYITAHRNKTFVILLGGEVLEHKNIHRILGDLVLLHSLGCRLVIVHGSRPQIDKALAQRGITSRFINGRRLTTDAMISAVVQAVGQQRILIEAALSTDTEASPMRGARVRVSSGNFIIAKPFGVVEGLDFGYSGELRNVDADGISTALGSGSIVLLSHIGYSRTGEAYNLNSEDVAFEVATALNADKLIAFTSLSELTKLTEGRGVISPQTIHSVSASNHELHAGPTALMVCKAVENGVERAHLIDHTEDGALLGELFTRQGTGILVSSTTVEVLRRATIEDAGRLTHLLKPLEEAGALIPRSVRMLESEIKSYFVIEKEGHLVGCAALHPYPQTNSGELSSLAIRAEYRNGGRGDRLLRRIEEEARSLQLEKLYVLSTKTAHWFLERGFAEIPPSTLPEAKQKDYDQERSSKVFEKKLGTSKPIPH